MSALYLIGLGSNMRHPVFGAPRMVLNAAVCAMEDAGLNVLAFSKIIASRPLGPSLREYANAAAVVESDFNAPELLASLQSIEVEFGRSGGQRKGQRWRSRVLDLDILMWSGGIWQDDRLIIPHPQMSRRHFVLGPAASIAGDWRDPISNRSLRQLNASLNRHRKRARPSGRAPILA